MAICHQQKKTFHKKQSLKSFKDEQIIKKARVRWRQSIQRSTAVLLQLLKNERMGIFARIDLAQSIIIIIVTLPSHICREGSGVGLSVVVVVLTL